MFEGAHVTEIAAVGVGFCAAPGLLQQAWKIYTMLRGTKHALQLT